MGVLNTIFSTGNVAKRRIKDFAKNPRAYLEMAGDQQRRQWRENPEEQALNYFNPEAGLAGLAGVVKPKGGNWLTGSVENALKGLVPKAGAMNRSANSVMEEMLSTYPTDKLEMMSPDTRATVDAAFARLRPQVSIQNWIEGPLTKYVKTRMASPEDEVRKLAEQGILHFEPRPLSPADVANAQSIRANATRFGHSTEMTDPLNPGNVWENRADMSVMPRTVQHVREMLKVAPQDEAWLARAAPDAPVYGVWSDVKENLGFPHLIDELSNALNPASGLPRHLQLSPEAMQNLSMEKAVRRVADINAWRAAQKIEANRKLAEQASLVREYNDPALPNPKGLRYVELRLPEGIKKGDPGYEQAVKDLEAQLKYEGDVMGHCVGGYCDDVLSGRSRIFSLRDAKGEPHVTVEVAPMDEDRLAQYIERNYPGGISKAFEDINADPDATYMADWIRKKIAVPNDIVQIKGKQNRAPNEEYLPFVQDFVRNNPLGGQWSDVGDLGNTGLIDLGKLTKGFTMGIPEPLYRDIGRALDTRFGSSGSVSQRLADLLKENEVSGYMSPEELLDLINPIKKASGGSVTASLQDSGYNSSVPSWDIFSQ